MQALAAAIELCARLDHQRLVLDIAFDARGGLQYDASSTDHAADVPAHDDLAAANHPRHARGLANDDGVAVNLPFDLAIDSQRTVAADPDVHAGDLDVFP